MKKIPFLFLIFFLSCQRESPDHVQEKLTQRPAESISSARCPDGYLKIRENEDYQVASFCVMKYEARQDPFGRPVSMAENLPWTGITQQEAKARCQALGPRYDLLSNPEWMVIATEVFYQEKNWSEGEVLQGHMARGWSGHGSWNLEWVTNLDPVTAPSTADCRYNLAGSSCAARGEHLYRRTLFLADGEEIWDFSGHTWNWVDWTLGGDLSPAPQGCLAEWVDLKKIDCSGLDLADIYPSRYQIERKHGLGLFYGGEGGAALRGGPRPWFASGPFALILVASSDGKSDTFSFRCVYRPHHDEE